MGRGDVKASCDGAVCLAGGAFTMQVRVVSLLPRNTRHTQGAARPPHFLSIKARLNVVAELVRAGRVP